MCLQAYDDMFQDLQGSRDEAFFHNMINNAIFKKRWLYTCTVLLILLSIGEAITAEKENGACGCNLPQS
jgi:hypothetical protein